MRAKFSISQSLIIVILFAANCSNAQNKTGYGTMILQFDNVAGNQHLQLDKGVYTNASGEQFTVTNLQYFISNIKLITTSGNQYVVPQDSCYFLIDEADSASRFCTIHVPAAEYKSISFLVGVDSLRNTMNIDKRTGILDPASSDMYWQWNSGYICLKIEGISPSAPVDPLGLHKYRYHIGGFGGYKSPSLNNIKTVVLTATNRSINVTANQTGNIHIIANILKLFSGEANVSIAQHASVMFNPYSVVIADNYARMFRLAAQ